MVANVDAVVDLSATPEVAVDGDTVTVTLPRPTLQPARVDPAQSRIVARTRGVSQELSGLIGDPVPPDDSPLWIRGAAKIDALAAQSQLTSVAEHSTTDLVSRIAESLGFRPHVIFVQPAPAKE